MIESGSKLCIPPTHEKFGRICDISYNICKKFVISKLLIL